MPSTYTVNLGIEKPATGEQSGTWGDTTNVNFDILDQAINGAVVLTLANPGTSGTPNLLEISNGSTSDGRNKWIELTDAGDLGGTSYLRLDPNDAEKIVFVRNNLSGGQSAILFQGTYSTSNDFEVPAGCDVVLKFDGNGTSATVVDVYNKLRVTALTTPLLTTADLTATTADINGGTIDSSVIGGATAAAVTGTTVVANTSLNIAADGATVTGIKDEDDMVSNSATKLATQQSIKAYVDAQVGSFDTLSEVLAQGNTSGTTNLVIDSGQVLTTNTVNETTVGTGVTIDSVLLKDDVVNATDIETSTISANDGTLAINIANTTGAVDIDTSLNVDGTVTADGLTVDGAGTTVLSSLVSLGDNTSYADLTFNSSDTSNGTINFADATDSNVGRIEYNHSDNSLLFRVNDAERFRIDSAGNVGIGTTSVDFAATGRTVLHVEGPSGALLALEATGNRSYIFQNGADLLVESDSASGNMIFGTNASTERMRIDASGTVKISHADTASEGLRVIQTTGARTSGGALGIFYDDQSGTTQPTLQVIQNGTGDILQLFDGGSQVVTVKDGGNVGIGTISPSSALHVNSSNDGPIFDSGGTGNTNHALLVRDSGNNQLLRVNNNGNVGIGESSPSSLLHLKKASDTADIILESSGGSGKEYLIGSRTDGSLNIYDVTASTERLRIDSSGRLLVGTTTASLPVSVGDRSGAALNYINGTANIVSTDSGIFVSKTTTDDNSVGYGLQLTNNANTVGARSPMIGFSALSQSGGYNHLYAGINGIKTGSGSDTNWNRGAIQFSIGGGSGLHEKMRLDPDGNLLVGSISSPGNKFRVVADFSNLAYLSNTAGTGVYLVSGATSWTGVSDERVKDIIEPITGAMAKFTTLRTVIGKYKTDAEGIRRPFLIAQDVQAVFPEVVDTQDDEAGTLGLQYEGLIPSMIAAMKEQQTLIEALTARITALEAK